MGSYYYLVAQLPFLHFEAPPPIDAQAFLEEAEKWVPEGEMALLRQIEARGLDRARPVPHSLFPVLFFEIQLREDLALWRQARLRGEDYRPVSFPRSLLDEGTPLEVELRLLRLRWDALEDSAADHHFDLEALVLYLCKLLIVRRRHTFDRQRGTEVFRQLSEVAA